MFKLLGFLEIQVLGRNTRKCYTYIGHPTFTSNTQKANFLFTPTLNQLEVTCYRNSEQCLKQMSFYFFFN